jgi:uncharacterized membrane protein
VIIRIKIIGGFFIYYNPADARIIVPKRWGIGTTLNFGHPKLQIAVWLVLVVLLGVLWLK